MTASPFPPLPSAGQLAAHAERVPTSLTTYLSRPASIDALDVPLPIVAADAARLAAEKAALLAEQRHQFLDLDVDSACCLPGTTCPACPPKGTEPPGGAR